MKKNRLLIHFLVIISIISTSFLIYFSPIFKPQRNFSKFSMAFIQEMYGDDPLSARFAFENPGDFHLKTKDKGLRPYDRDAYLHRFDQVSSLCIRAERLNEGKLNKVQRQTQRTTLAYLKHQLLGKSYSYFENPLSFSSGAQINLPVLLSEYPIQNEKDVKNYLVILGSIPAYFDSLTEYEKDRQNRGIPLYKEDLDLVIEQCKSFDIQKCQTLFAHPLQKKLQTIFKRRKKKRLYYLQKAEELAGGEVSSAYQKLANDLAQFQKDAPNRQGLCCLKNGKEYYEYLVQTQSGCELTLTEMEEMILKEQDHLYKEIKKCATGKIEDSLMIEADQELSMDTENYIPALMKRFTNLPALNTYGKITLKQVPRSLYGNTAPAYYFTPGLFYTNERSASHTPNIIYYNPQNTKDSLSMFTTLAHEGYPGHMYETMYHLSKKGVNGDNLLRYLLSFPGYHEGWALYWELEAYRYAYEDRKLCDYANLIRLGRELQLCCLSYLEILVHAHGFTAEEITPYLNKLAIRDSKDIENIYAYLVNEPGNYLKYYLSYLELKECKKLYQKKGGSSSFYTFYLDHGPDSFTEIRKSIYSSEIMLSK